MTPAHHTDGLAELVCSNSFRSDDAEHNAVGLLHAEMRALGSLIMAAADAHRVPAGSALAVDREGFAAAVTERLAAHPNIEIVRERVDALPASGLDHRRHRAADRDARWRNRSAPRPAPTPSPSSTRSRRSSTATSIDMDVAWMASALGQGRTQGLHQLPDDEGAVSRLPPGPARRREDRVQGVGEGHALFRGLHADRGDGRARRRHACATGR